MIAAAALTVPPGCTTFAKLFLQRCRNHVFWLES